MAVSVVQGVKISGIASAVPQPARSLAEEAEVFGEEEVKKLSQNLGIHTRHMAPRGMCASDLCFATAERLLRELGWDRASVDLLVFVSQTPDYILPPTSCVLHERLGLEKGCAAFDLNLGCSGYIYGLWIASQLVANSQARRGLLLVGDTISRLVSPADRATAPLFGDAGTATALEKNDHTAPMVYDLGTDGQGHRNLIVPAGGFRQPRTEKTTLRIERVDGNIRSEEDLFMDGAEIFSFTLREIPALIRSVLAKSEWPIDSVDAFVFHQASGFILQHLTRKLRLPPEKVVVALEDYGNTTSASVPLAMTVALRSKLSSSSMNLVLAGFGVGLSWGAASLTCGPLVAPELLVVG